ncbi:MAG TPA: zinc ribbon domain-containing protein YjdM [Alphaproteobacteria bacterium]|nr:zinc ribbon domain-containing protein YjdM [Alphaproteobacteria bacterium]
MNSPACVQCGMENTYQYQDNFVCPDCGHEWIVTPDTENQTSLVVKDANGNTLKDGDAAVLIKDLKVKGSSITLKMGTKIKSIRLVDGDHDVDCKTDKGQFMLKSCFLKKG